MPRIVGSMWPELIMATRDSAVSTAIVQTMSTVNLECDLTSPRSKLVLPIKLRVTVVTMRMPGRPKSRKW